MHSAFWRGIGLLSEPESDPIQSRGKTVEKPGKSELEVKGISGVPRNVTQLKPVINELMRRVIVIL
jgi:hypothetical protein